MARSRIFPISRWCRAELNSPPRIEGIAQEGEIRTPNPCLMFDTYQIPRISVANEGNRRDLRKSRIQGEHILSSTDAFYSGRIVRKTRVNSTPRIPKGLGGSNPSRSASESQV